jgi:hypothetical protein
VKKKTSNVPVFLIYAGIIHAIGLALLMPMLITLPGPGRLAVPQPATIDIEIAPAPLAAKIEPDSEQTAALPPAAPSAEQDAVEPDSGGAAVANVSPEAETSEDEPAVTASPVEDDAKPKDAVPAKAAPRATKKPVVKRSRTAKPAGRRPAKTDAKIAPFNGALTGLFTPGAPANRRR